MFIALLAGCPMPEPSPEPDPMAELTAPGTMAAPTLEVGNGQLRVNWTPPENNGSDITAYELRHSDDGGSNWSDDITTADAPAVSTAIEGLTNGTPYVAQVRARNSAGAGEWSESSAEATPIAAVPTAPNGFMLSVSMQTITATWTAPTDAGDSAITHYELQHREVGADEWEPVIATADADTLTLTIPILTKGAEYEVQVYAVNTDGNGNPTEIMKITIPATTPSAPIAPTLTAGNTQITATWGAPNDGGSEITAYHVQHRISASGTWSTADTDNIATITDGGTTSHIITGLTNDTSYQVRVRAVNAIGTGGWSLSATETSQFSATQVPYGTAATVSLTPAVNAIIAAQSPTVSLTVVEPGTLAVSGSGDITITAATAPVGVTVPTVNASTGVVSVATGTTAGTYLVYGTESGGTDILFAEYFYVTVSPADNAALDAAVAAGISNWGNTADLNYIITTAVTNMAEVFFSSVFNGDISGWDTSAVTSMYRMFNEALLFNGDISGWDVSSVTNMRFMFRYASVFTGDISGWDVSSVTNMSTMFNQASAFNGDISGWDVSKVMNMSLMFNNTSAFNQNISRWDVSSVTNMSSMFHAASAFNQDLEEWKDHWSTAAGTLDDSGKYTGNKTNTFTDSGVENGIIDNKGTTDTSDDVVVEAAVGTPSWY